MPRRRMPRGCRPNWAGSCGARRAPLFSPSSRGGYLRCMPDWPLDPGSRQQAALSGVTWMGLPVRSYRHPGAVQRASGAPQTRDSGRQTPISACIRSVRHPGMPREWTCLPCSCRHPGMPKAYPGSRGGCLRFMPIWPLDPGSRQQAALSGVTSERKIGGPQQSSVLSRSHWLSEDLKPCQSAMRSLT